MLDPYSYKRTTSYGVDNDKMNNSLFVSGKFGGGLIEPEETEPKHNV